MNNNVLNPTEDRILIEPLGDEDYVTKNKIVLPKKHEPIGKIVRMGPLVTDFFKEGDEIRYDAYPDEVKIDGKKYLILEEDDILGKYEVHSSTPHGDKG